MRFYASLLPCDVKTDNELLYELIPEFEKLGIPALSFDEVTAHWDPIREVLRSEMNAPLEADLKALWPKRAIAYRGTWTRQNTPLVRGALRAYATAQLVAIVKQGTLPFPVVIGKTRYLCRPSKESGTNELRHALVRGAISRKTAQGAGGQRHLPKWEDVVAPRTLYSSTLATLFSQSAKKAQKTKKSP